jgi:hypothetical protein
MGYSKQLREGHFFRNEWVVYDYPQKTFLSKTTNKDNSFYYKQGSIPGPVQDILSSLYYIRTKPLHIGDEITLDANTKDNWPLVIKVVSKARVNGFNTVIVEPFLRQGEGIFVQKGRKLRVWLTDDSRHIPVRMTVEVAFGHVSTSLHRVNGKPASEFRKPPN